MGLDHVVNLARLFSHLTQQLPSVPLHELPLPSDTRALLLYPAHLLLQPVEQLIHSLQNGRLQLLHLSGERHLLHSDGRRVLAGSW